MQKNIIVFLWHKFHVLILYGLIGCFTSSLDFVFFSILQWLGIYYIVANCFSVLVGITTSFYLNRKFNFKVKNKTVKRFTMFLTVGLCGMMASNLILYLCIEKIGMDNLLSKLLSIVLVVTVQFLLNRFITFRTTNQ